jgi:hypothetical protein
MLQTAYDNTKYTIVGQRGGFFTPIHRVELPAVNQQIVIKQFGEFPVVKGLPSTGHFDIDLATKVIADQNQLRTACQIQGLHTPQLLWNALVPTEFNLEQAAKIAVQHFIQPSSVEADINVPIILAQSATTSYRLVQFEADCGKCLRTIIRENPDNLAEIVQTHVQQTLHSLARLSTDIALDTKPDNFVVTDGSVYYIDFMPPAIFSEYAEDARLLELFPTNSLNIENYTERVRQYTTKAGRIERYVHYLNRYLQESGHHLIAEQIANFES